MEVLGIIILVVAACFFLFIYSGVWLANATGQCAGLAYSACRQIYWENSIFIWVKLPPIFLGVYLLYRLIRHLLEVRNEWVQEKRDLQAKLAQEAATRDVELKARLREAQRQELGTLINKIFE